MNENISLISKYISIITKQICEKYGYDEQTALRNFTSSETCRMLKNPELEMWEFCPDIIFEMWECEQITGNPRNSMSILQVLCKYKIVQKNLFKWTELNSVRFYVIRKISTCQ